MTLYKTPAGEQMVMQFYETALAHWAVPYTTHIISTRYGETFIIASGDPAAPPLILLHGAGSNSTVWAGDVKTYTPYFRVYAVDLPGEAGKSSPQRPDWTSSAFGEWLLDVFGELQLEQAVLVGISQGAWTALKFACAYPQRVAQLVLIAPGGIVPDRPEFLLRAVGSMILGQWGIRRLVKALFGAQPVPDGVTEQVVQITREFKPRIGVLPIFTDDELRQLTMPTLLLGGDRDIIRDLSRIAARLQSLLPALTVQIQAGGGHALINLSERILQFLQQVETQPA